MCPQALYESLCALAFARCALWIVLPESGQFSALADRKPTDE